MEPNPTCPNCGAVVDLTRRNAVTSVIYRHVMCRGCGVICILEGPEQNVLVGGTPVSPGLSRGESVIDPVIPRAKPQEIQNGQSVLSRFERDANDSTLK